MRFLRKLGGQSYPCMCGADDCPRCFPGCLDVEDEICEVCGFAIKEDEEHEGCHDDEDEA